ncbi:MAG TPA: hypothetical protein VLB44_07680, partial [Kofleriaceae bacterium]|nr:hypothetical protein [Kofleriaceae bacterium]
PTYLLAAHTFHDAQMAFHDAADIFGMSVGGEVSDLSAALHRTLGVDPLDTDAVAAIGVDLQGAVVVFSEDVDPTFVVHLSDPGAMTAFLDSERSKGMKTTSQVADGIEVFSATVGRDLQLSWAVDHDWLWVHFATVSQPFVAWFEHSHKAGAPTWGDAWRWAEKQAKAPGLIGFADLRDVMASVAKREPDLAACAKQFDGVSHAGVAIATDGKQIDARLSFDIGGSAPTIGGQLFAPPPGWAAASSGVPVSAQWNLDAQALAAWVSPCLGKNDANDLHAMLDAYGVRTARGLVQSFDPDEKSGVGAVALDLTSKRFINEQLDQVPMRSRLEKDRTFGVYKGKHLSVPFVATADYVLDDHLFVAAMGDGLLAKLGTGAPAPASAIASIDVIPSGMSVDVWQWLLEQVDAPSPKRLAQRLQNWQQLHVGARLDGTYLVIEAAGTRR